MSYLLLVFAVIMSVSSGVLWLIHGSYNHISTSSNHTSNHNSSNNNNIALYYSLYGVDRDLVVDSP